MALPQIDVLLHGFGASYNNGKAYGYHAGTTTLLTWYTDANATIPAANPITLDSTGKATVYCSERLRLDVKNSAGVSAPGFPIDNIGFASSITESYVDVSEYGAVGNGITDDSDAIIAAVATGNHVNLKSGCTYLVSKMIQLNANQTLNGNGAAIKRAAQVSTTTTTTITGGVTNQITVADGSIFKVGQSINVVNGTSYDQSNRIISNINGNVITTSTSINLTGGAAAGSASGTSTVYLCWYTIKLNEGAKVINLEINGNSSNWTRGRWENTVEIYGYGDRTLVQGCYVHDIPGEAMTGGGDYCTWDGNYIFNAKGNGIHLSGNNHPVVSNNRIVNCNIDLNVGHYIGATGFSDLISNAVIVDNYMEACYSGVGAISSSDNSDVTIANNTIVDMTNTAIDGVWPTNQYSKNVIITGNRIYNSVAIFITNVDPASTSKPHNWIVSDNYLYNTTIALQTAEYVRVSGNIIECSNDTDNLISIAGSSSHIDISGNILVGGINAMYCTDSSYVLIDGNTMVNQYNAGVYADTTNSYTTVHGNTVNNDNNSIATAIGILCSGTYVIVRNNTVKMTQGRSGIEASSGSYIDSNSADVGTATYSIFCAGGTSNMVVCNNQVSAAITNSGAANNTVFNNRIIGALPYSSTTIRSLGTPTVFTSTIGTAFGQRDKQHTIDVDTSPYDAYNIDSAGATGGWKGAVNLRGSYNAGSMSNLFRAWADNGFVVAEASGRFRLPSIRGPYADNAAAGVAGLTAGEVFYQTTTGALMVKL